MPVTRLATSQTVVNLAISIALIVMVFVTVGLGQQQRSEQQNPAAAPPKPQAILPAHEPPPVAPDFKYAQRPLPPADRVGVDVAEPMPLTLAEAIRMALENNRDITIARINVRMAGFDLTAARGLFDPRFFSESFFERNVTPVSSLLGGGNGKVTQTSLTGRFGLEGFSPVAGGSFQINASSSRLTTDNQFTALNPQFPSVLTFSYTQPLWRGLRIDDNRRRVEVAKKNLSLTDAQFREQVIDVITRVEMAYWDLTQALRNLQVQIDAVKLAQTQLESNRRLVEQGILAPIDIVAVETQLATFEQNVYSAQEQVTLTENSLKTLLLPDRNEPLWSKALLPITPVKNEPPQLALQDAVAAALANRPEVDQLQVAADINKINTRFFRDQTRPQIDLIGSYSAQGLAGTTVVRSTNAFNAGNIALMQRVNDLSILAGLPPLPPTMGGELPDNLIGGAGRSLAGLLAQDFPSVRVGLRLSLPLRNRTAEANLGRALAEGQRIEAQEDQLALTVEAQVRNALQSLRSAEARLAAAAVARAAAEQLYESEQRRLQAGLTTVFLVLQRQTDLITTRARELQAQTDLNKAIANFQRVVGNTLQAHSVALQQ